MSDQHDTPPDDEGAQQQLVAIRAALAATPPPPLAEIDSLLAQIQPLTGHAQEAIVQQARQLELKALGALLVHQAENMRALARQMQRLARWLPPDRAEQN